MTDTPRQVFGREYVQELRRQAAGYRVRLHELQDDKEALRGENAALRLSKDRIAVRLVRALETNKKLREEA